LFPSKQLPLSNFRLCAGIRQKAGGCEFSSGGEFGKLPN